MAPNIPPKGESRALGYSEFASLAKRVHTTGGIYEHTPTKSPPNSNVTNCADVGRRLGHDECHNGLRARVVYTFDPASCPDPTRLIPLEESETVFILQSDMGSGWTFVYSRDREKTGFVPTTALQEMLPEAAS